MGFRYLSGFVMPCELADDSVVRGKVLHEDGRDLGKVRHTSGACRREQSLVVFLIGTAFKDEEN